MAGDKRFVFPGLNTQTIDGTINCNSLLGALAEIGFKGIMTGHGYRGVASTILADNGFDKAHIEVQLAHADENKTAAAYNHARYLAQRTALMQWWADYLDAELKKGKRGVVAIRKTA
jgi:integrase